MNIYTLVFIGTVSGVLFGYCWMDWILRRGQRMLIASTTATVVFAWTLYSIEQLR